MTQEEKQLLLKDLCARLPYGVKINIYDYSGTMKNEELNAFYINSTYNIEYRKLRPYLRPMSSMTEVEKNEFVQICPSIVDVNTIYGFDCNDFEQFSMVEDFLLSHHFDYRGLIEKGLALEAPEDMYKTE